MTPHGLVHSSWGSTSFCISVLVVGCLNELRCSFQFCFMSMYEPYNDFPEELNDVKEIHILKISRCNGFNLKFRVPS